MKKRIIAAILDLLLVLIMWQILSYVYYEFTHNYIPYYFAVLIYALRDLIFKNSSIFKKALGLEIVKQDGSKPKIYEIILRNITLFIWPIDFLFLIKNKNRICDNFFKLKVEEKNKVNTTLLIISIIFLTFSIFLFTYTNTTHYKIKKYTNIKYVYLDNKIYDIEENNIRFTVYDLYNDNIDEIINTSNLKLVENIKQFNEFLNNHKIQKIEEGYYFLLDKESKGEILFTQEKKEYFILIILENKAKKLIYYEVY